MAAIRASDTKPELIVRKALFSSGFRYRLHDRSLPGKPDVALKKYKTCIFVNGCFWHMHRNCQMFVLPKTRTEFWRAKLLENAERDQVAYEKLIQEGWKVIVVWECALKGRDRILPETVAQRLSSLITADIRASKIIEIQ